MTSTSSSVMGLPRCLSAYRSDTAPQSLCKSFCIGRGPALDPYAVSRSISQPSQPCDRHDADDGRQVLGSRPRPFLDVDEAEGPGLFDRPLDGAPARAAP